MDIPPTNMYNKTPPDNLNQILADLSIGDTKHDFGLTQGQFSDIKSSYDKGLPPPGTTDKFPSEEKCLSSVVAKLKGSAEEAYVPINVANSTYISGTNSEHTITTINGYEYNVTYTDAKPNKTIISAETFYGNLKLSETDIAIVVDAASISFIEILSKGEILVNGTRPNVYYIYGAEVVNDPATKKHPDSLFNKKENEGVNLIPCISTNPSSFVYPYTFDVSLGANTTYLNQFFTNYNFGLSEIIPTIKGKSTNYTTNLTITDKTDGALINPLVDSKSKNDISFLTKVIAEIKSRLFKKSNLQKTFLLNSSYQQKRSGDWLQVLLCSALRDKSRGIKDYSKKDNINIIDKVQRVFFVTHDRIALAFALLNGIDCIFTHHHSTTHLHSAFVYKLNDPIQTAANEEKFANDVKVIDILKVESKGSKLKVSLTEIISLITEYIENKYTTSVTKTTEDLDTTITAKVTDTSVMPKDVFDRYVTDIFTKALILIFYRNIAPDLSEVLADFTDAKTNFESLFVGMDNKQVIRTYNELQTKIDATKAIIMKATESIEKSIGEKSKNMISFKKSSIYKYADTWKWDTSLVKNRDLSRISNIMDPTIYGADRNIFLYNINDLPVDIKRKITTIFYGLYERIMNMPMEPQTVQDNRFKAIASSFCVEVLLTLGGGGGVSSSDITAQRIIDTMDSFMNKKDKLSVFDAVTEIAVEIPINALLTDSVIIKEDNQYNINKSNIDVGVLQTADDGIFQINTKQSTIPLINLVLFTKIQIENFKAITDNAIAANARANIRAANALARARTANKTQQVNKPGLSGPAERPLKRPRDNSGANSPPPTTTQRRLSEPIANRIQQITDTLFSKPSLGGGDPLDTTAATDNTIHLELLHLEELSKSLSQLSTYNKTKVFNVQNTINVFSDTSVHYHPLVPLYLFTQAYNNLINNENIAESMDFELYVNCFIFITIAKDLLTETYSANPNTINKMSAYAIGIGLRELLFTTNIFDNRYSEVKAVVDIDDAIYSLFETLSMSVSGKITIPDNQKPEIKLFFTSKLFENFVRKLEIGKIFNNELQTITDDNIIDFVTTLRKKASQLSSKLANTIIADRGSIANPKSDGVTVASASITKTVEPMTPAAKRIKISSAGPVSSASPVSSAGPADVFGGNAQRQPKGKKTKKNKKVKKYTKKGVKSGKKLIKNKTKKHRRKRNKHTRKH